jgi:hypothetical protein
MRIKKERDRCITAVNRTHKLQSIFYWYWGGDEGTRTLDPRIANAVLSQLSYIPRRRKVYHAARHGARV